MFHSSRAEIPCSDGTGFIFWLLVSNWPLWSRIYKLTATRSTAASYGLLDSWACRMPWSLSVSWIAPFHILRFQKEGSLLFAYLLVHFWCMHPHMKDTGRPKRHHWQTNFIIGVFIDALPHATIDTGLTIKRHFLRCCFIIRASCRPYFLLLSLLSRERERPLWTIA